MATRPYAAKGTARRWVTTTTGYGLLVHPPGTPATRARVRPIVRLTPQRKGCGSVCAGETHAAAALGFALFDDSLRQTAPTLRRAPVKQHKPTHCPKTGMHTPLRHAYAAQNSVWKQSGRTDGLAVERGQHTRRRAVGCELHKPKPRWQPRHPVADELHRQELSWHACDRPRTHAHSQCYFTAKDSGADKGNAPPASQPTGTSTAGGSLQTPRR